MRTMLIGCALLAGSLICTLSLFGQQAPFPEQKFGKQAPFPEQKTGKQAPFPEQKTGKQWLPNEKQASDKLLTEADVVALISHQVDDPATIARIEKHKLAFKVDEAFLSRIKQANPSPAVLAALEKFRSSASQDPVGKGIWTVQNSGVKDTLRAVTFLDDKVGIVVGDNKTILKTTNGGKTWKRVIEAEKGVPLCELVFSTPKLGWTMDGAGLILRTTDGGDTWSKMPPPDTGFGACIPTLAAAGSTCFYMTHGFVTPSIFQTTDAGKNWTVLNDKLPLSGYGPCARLAFTDAKHAFFVTTSNGGKLGRTEDGGKTWQFQKTEEESNQDSPRICFVDKNHGWYSLPDRDVYATVDGGKSWTRCNRKFGGSVADLHFTNVKLGHALRCFDMKTPDAQGEVMRTTDGGKTWTSVGGEIVAPSYINAVCFPAANHGWVVGYEGYIAHYEANPVEPVVPQASDGTWQVQDSGVKDTLRAVTFLDDMVGIAVGDNRTIIKTVDGGKTWKRVNKREDNADLREVMFSTPKLGWATSGDNVTLHTTDGGDTWKEIPPPYRSFGPVLTTQAAFGSTYFCLTFGLAAPVLYQTSDAGKKWAQLSQDLPVSSYSGSTRMVFTDAKQGYFVTAVGSGKIGRTLDGGKTWELQKTGEITKQDSPRICFVDKSHGWYSLYDGDVYATTDGGKTWTRCHRKFSGNVVDLHFTSVKLGHAMRCFDMKTPGAQAEVMRTTDGGKTWTSVGGEIVAPSYINAVCFPSANHGWVVGYGGYIAHYQKK